MKMFVSVQLDITMHCILFDSIVFLIEFLNERTYVIVSKSESVMRLILN